MTCLQAIIWILCLQAVWLEVLDDLQNYWVLVVQICMMPRSTAEYHYSLTKNLTQELRFYWFNFFWSNLASHNSFFERACLSPFSCLESPKSHSCFSDSSLAPEALKRASPSSSSPCFALKLLLFGATILGILFESPDLPIYWTLDALRQSKCMLPAQLDYDSEALNLMYARHECFVLMYYRQFIRS